MVFDRRFTADSPRYLAIRLEPQRLSDGLRPPLQDYCVVLTRSFLMVLDGNVSGTLGTALRHRRGTSDGRRLRAASQSSGHQARHPNDRHSGSR